MGGDGGVIQNDRRFLRGAQGNLADQKEGSGPNTITSSERQWSRSCHCAISAQELAEPVVACELGNLFNKDSAINAILEKRMSASFAHIRGLKDLKNCIFTPNPEYRASLAASELLSESNMSKFICPISRVEFKGSQPFVILWTSGYVLSERAVKEIGIEALQAEYGPFADSDIVKLLPFEEELPDIAAQLHEKRGAKDVKSKEKKEKKRKQESQEVDANAEAGNEDAKKMHKSSQSNDLESIENNSNNNSSNSNSSSSSAGVCGGITSITTLSSSKLVAQSAAESIENTKKNSAVYKSLFRDNSKETSSRDLFINVAGMRYNLG